MFLLSIIVLDTPCTSASLLSHISVSLTPVSTNFIFLYNKQIVLLVERDYHGLMTSTMLMFLLIHVWMDAVFEITLQLNMILKILKDYY